MHRMISHSTVAGQEPGVLNRRRAARDPPDRTWDDDFILAIPTFGRIRVETALTAEMPHLAVTMHMEPEGKANSIPPGRETLYR
jgi:hypothetical protein